MSTLVYLWCRWIYVVAGSWHNTVNLPACHMNGCLIYCLSNRNVANSESQGAVKSNTKNQMRSKHIPFLFFIFLSVNKVPVLRMGMPFPSVCMFISGVSMFSGVTALSWPSPPMAKKGQRLLLKHPQRMPPLFRRWMSVSSGTATLDYPRMTAPWEEMALTKVETLSEKQRALSGEAPAVPGSDG